MASLVMLPSAAMAGSLNVGQAGSRRPMAASKELPSSRRPGGAPALGYSQGMRRLAYALMIAALSAAPAWADETPPLCKALRGLSDETRRTGEPQRISAGVDFAAPAPCRVLTDT